MIDHTKGIVLSQKQIENRIFTIRDCQVMIDRYLAEMYQVETKVLNQAVKRNLERFPAAFRLQLNNTEKKELISRTAKSIWTTGNYDQNDLTISESELEDIKLISANILEFIHKLDGMNVEFRPTLKGYGFIPDLEADLSIDNALFEIKTVKRKFKSSDLKQLFIYLALRQVSKAPNWQYAGLYNPRKGTYGTFNVSNLVFSLTGGRSPNETFENLLNGLTRDIEIDSKF